MSIPFVRELISMGESVDEKSGAADVGIKTASCRSSSRADRSVGNVRATSRSNATLGCAADLFRVNEASSKV